MSLAKVYRLRSVVNASYQRVIDIAKTYNPHIGNKIYSIYRRPFILSGYSGELRRAENYSSRHSFTGGGCCGLLTRILGLQLKERHPRMELLPAYTMKRNEKGDIQSKYDDHMCLLSDRIIIDPTYKQFLDSHFCGNTTYYSTYLYEKLPPFFVGTRSQLWDTLRRLEKTEASLFGRTSIDPEKLMYERWSFLDPPPFNPVPYGLAMEWKKMTDQEKGKYLTLNE